MIDFNFVEIGLLVVLAVIIFGPEKLPELARKAARVINHLRMIGNDARSQLRRELGPEFDDLRLSDLNPKNFVSRHLLSGEEVEDLRQLRDDAVAAGTLVKDAVNEAGAPEPDQDGTDSQPDALAAAAAVAVPQVAFDPEAT